MYHVKQTLALLNRPGCSLYRQVEQDLWLTVILGQVSFGLHITTPGLGPSHQQNRRVHAPEESSDIC